VNDPQSAAVPSAQRVCLANRLRMNLGITSVVTMEKTTDCESRLRPRHFALRGALRVITSYTRSPNKHRDLSERQHDLECRHQRGRTSSNQRGYRQRKISSSLQPEMYEVCRFSFNPASCA
jgi:hypothetical protein